MRKIYINTVCMITEVLLGILLVADSALFQTVGEYFGVDNITSWIGVFSCAFFIGLTVISVISGELSERMGKKNVICIFSFIVTAGSLFVSFSSTPYTAAAAYVITGFGFGAVEGLVNGVMLDENKSASSSILNLTSLFFAVGAVISPLLINRYLTGGGDWKNVYILTAVLYAVLGVLFLLMKTSVGRTVRKKEGLVSFSFLKNRYFLLACILIFLYIGVETGSTAWAVNIFSDTLGSYSLAVFWCACGVSRFIASRIKKQKSVYMMLFICLACGLTGIGGVLLNSESVSACILFYAAIGFGLGPLWPTFFSFGTDAAGKHTGAGSGMVMMFSSLGGAVLSPVIGMFSGLSILGVCFVFLAAVTVVQILYSVMKYRDGIKGVQDENISYNKTEQP